MRLIGKGIDWVNWALPNGSYLSLAGEPRNRFRVMISRQATPCGDLPNALCLDAATRTHLETIERPWQLADFHDERWVAALLLEVIL